MKNSEGDSKTFLLKMKLMAIDQDLELFINL